MLNAVPGLGPVKIKGLVDNFGSAEKVLELPRGEIISAGVVNKNVAENITQWEKHFDLKKECDLIKKNKVSILVINDPEYPAILKEIYDPPIVLYIRGAILDRDEYAIGIVGARNASYYGLNTAGKIGRELAARGFTIVSGGARGVDTAAHEGAIQGNGRTIAVFGCGVDIVYPPENEKLANKIVDNGAIISEFPFGTPPVRQHFPKRNRIISGLCRGIVVVEAGKNSGSLITARLATEQGREVFSVPGRIDATTSQGTNVLIREGAKPVIDVSDILEEFGALTNVTSSSEVKSERKSQTAGLSHLEVKLFSSIQGEEYTVDQLVDITLVPVQDVWKGLASLEIKGLVKRVPGNKYVKKG